MDAITVFGAVALTAMMVTYALEQRHHGYILAFAVCCGLSAAYGFAIGAWPFGAVETVWAGIALRRFSRALAPRDEVT